MISLEEFKEIIELMKKFDDITNQLYNLNINLYESDIVSIPEIIVNKLWSIYITEEGIDWLNWWLYEDVEKIVEIEDVSLNLTTVEDLYSFLQKYNYLNVSL